MIYELRERCMNVVSEQLIPVRYKSLILDGRYRIDLIVEDTVIVELKSVETVLPVHRAQVLTYLRHTNKPLGLLRSEEHTSELQSQSNLVCRLLLEKKKKQ